MVFILQRANVSFVTLGCEERCTGDPARRMGDEGLFESFKSKNIETLRAHGARKIVTHCPHCLNTLKNEYSENGQQEFTVVHHSQLLSTLVQEGKIQLEPGAQNQSITFHDPCYLGQHNGEYDSPRAVVEAIPGATLLEMDAAGRSHFAAGVAAARCGWRAAGENALKEYGSRRRKKPAPTRLPLRAHSARSCWKVHRQPAGKQELVQIRDIAELVNEAIVR